MNGKDEQLVLHIKISSLDQVFVSLDNKVSGRVVVWRSRPCFERQFWRLPETLFDTFSQFEQDMWENKNNLSQIIQWTCEVVISMQMYLHLSCQKDSLNLMMRYLQGFYFFCLVSLEDMSHTPHLRVCVFSARHS